MAHLIDTEQLVADGILSPAQAKLIAEHARQNLLRLAINTVLCAGIVTAAAGLMALIIAPIGIALAGVAFLIAGIAIVLKARADYAMFGNATALIGAGMLSAGSLFQALEMVTVTQAGVILLIIGLILALPALIGGRHIPPQINFLSRALLILGTGLHLTGLAWLMEDLVGPLVMLGYGYASLVMMMAGYASNLRAVTALAIVPFAQILSTSTAYWSATYSFFSPEPTLSILQMGALIALALWLRPKVSPKLGAHLGILAIMAMIVANLCFLVGSLFGDVVGWSFVESASYYHGDIPWEQAEQAMADYARRSITISPAVFGFTWAVLLIIAVLWAARHGQRGLLNIALTFGVIHGYTQLFEGFYDQPLVWVIGGLAAIPLAWAIWKLNVKISASQPKESAA